MAPFQLATMSTPQPRYEAGDAFTLPRWLGLVIGWDHHPVDTVPCPESLETNVEASASFHVRTRKRWPPVGHNRSKRLHQCQFCNYTTSLTGNLRKHIRIHTGQKPFKCDVCSYTCNQRHDLKIHMWTHTGEKPYSCNFCPCAFRRKHDLKRHIETQHA